MPCFISLFQFVTPKVCILVQQYLSGRLLLAQASVICPNMLSCTGGGSALQCIFIKAVLNSYKKIGVSLFHCKQNHWRNHAYF